MRNQIIKGREFFILSRIIDNASMCSVIEVGDDCFKVKLKQLGKYEVDESVELFAMTDVGQLYFETIVKEVEGDILSLWFPIDVRYLQRREFSRINEIKEVILVDNDEEIVSNVIDLSAGGLKVSTIKQLEILKKYNLKINIENHTIECAFQPIRLEALGDQYITSGRFLDINNYDRIILVQYCFKRQIENSNK